MQWGFLLFILISASILLVAKADSEKYFGRRSTEAILEFKSKADVHLPGRFTLGEINREGDKRDWAMEEVNEQIVHLLGLFQSASFRREFRYPGVLGEKYKVDFTDIKRLEDGRKLISYDFKAKVVFHKRVFRNSNKVSVPIKLPRAYDLIYDLGVVDGVNLCTDDYYNEEGDFFYFWDPDMRGCPLRGNSTDVLRFKGTLKKLPNTRRSYPEYDRLYGKKELNISLFIGFVEDIENYRVVNLEDSAYEAAVEIEDDLEQRGFKLQKQLNRFRVRYNGRRGKGINFYSVYEKQVKTKLGNTLLVRVKLLLSDTDIASRDYTFHHFLVPAFESSDIVIYDGHSGLGGNLDLDQLPDINFNMKKYQIFFMNGCSSYPYFNGMFFKAKGGSKNLEVITSGLTTLSNTASSNIIAFMNNFLKGQTRSYQSILTELEKSNGEEDTYLTGVNGDEDNRWKPPRNN